MSIEIQCMIEKLIVITIKSDYSKVPSKSTVPTSAFNQCLKSPFSFKKYDDLFKKWGHHFQSSTLSLLSFYS